MRQSSEWAISRYEEDVRDTLQLLTQEDKAGKYDELGEQSGVAVSLSVNKQVVCCRLC